MVRGGSAYIITNKNNTVLYSGVTSELKIRIYNHKIKKDLKSFASRYNCDKLVFFKDFSTIEEAIAFEKQLKGTNRKKKEQLINEMNPDWKDLWDDLPD